MESGTLRRTTRVAGSCGRQGHSDETVRRRMVRVCFAFRGPDGHDIDDTAAPMHVDAVLNLAAARASTSPLDPGTRRVALGGLVALHDPDGLLAALKRTLARPGRRSCCGTVWAHVAFNARRPANRGGGVSHDAGS